MHRQLLVTLTTIVILVAANPTTTAQNSKRENLKGIGPLDLIIEDLQPDLERGQLTRAMLQTVVEDRLHQSGISLSKTADPYIYLNVNSFPINEDLYAYSIDLQVNASVTLAETGQVTVATIWSVAALGRVSSARLPTIINDVINQVDKLANDYVAVNLIQP
jgi:hypothetical protein|tara:strand:+ start:1035 stop:1520 length:486 start_codon:yes stop_codon:yes gene_type:complete